FKDSSGHTLNDLDTFADNGRVYQIDYTPTDVTITMVACVSTVSLSSSQNPSTIGQAVHFTPTSGQRPGERHPNQIRPFYDGSTQLGNPVNVSNNQAQLTTSTLSGGTRAIKAIYSGGNNIQGSSGTLSPPQVVKRINSSTTLTSDTNPVDYGATYTFTATVTSSSGSGPTPSGDVSFVDTTTGKSLGVRLLDNNGKAKLTVDGSSVTFLDAGLHTIKATFLGDDSYNTSSASFTETVNQVTTSTSVSASQSSSVYGEPVTYTATVTWPTSTAVGS